MNFQKSFVKFSPNTRMEDQQTFKQLLRINDASSLGKYLGVPIDIQGSKVHHFTPLLDKVSTSIGCWSHTNLSQPAELIIINDILLRKVLHYLSIFRVPATITNKLDSLMATFFLKGRYGKGIHWKRWGILQRPRNLGGLGVRNSSILNTALLMKKV